MIYSFHSTFSRRSRCITGLKNLSMSSSPGSVTRQLQALTDCPGLWLHPSKTQVSLFKCLRGPRYTRSSTLRVPTPSFAPSFPNIPSCKHPRIQSHYWRPISWIHRAHVRLGAPSNYSHPACSLLASTPAPSLLQTLPFPCSLGPPQPPVSLRTTSIS